MNLEPAAHFRSQIPTSTDPAYLERMAMAAEAPPALSDLPQAGKYGVILADPPWRFRTWNETNDAKSARRHYSLMEKDEIVALPVRDIAAKDCALFMWATWPTIQQAFPVMRAWGFRFSGLAWEWVKYNDETGKYAFGTGYGTRKNLEPCLLGIRGAPKLMNRSVRDFLMAKRREHSRKPEEQYERIESMYVGPRLEMFCRQSRPGWDAWGNQVGKFNDVDVVA